jgi:cyclophilin family peptidyl-prolyl cis-trans isomerase
VLVTSFGEITLELYTYKAPNHVRNFLRLAEVGAYQGLAFHRIVPGFVIQTGYLETRSEPPSERILKYVQNLEPELNDVLHEPGVLSMARGDERERLDVFFHRHGTATFLDYTSTPLRPGGRRHGVVMRSRRATDGDKPMG